MSEPSAYLYDAYISNSPADRSWVETSLVPRLQAAGLRLVVSDRLAVLDSSARAFLADQIEQSHYVIAVLSPDALRDQQTTYERTLALDRNFRDDVFCLLPVQITPLDPRQLPTQLAILTTVDFTQPEKVEDAFAQLLWIWERPQ
jgi:TIR domain